MGYTSQCTYGSCYVYKQNLPCADGSRQLLNGCCGAGTRGANRLSFDEDYNCLGYQNNRNNIHGETAEYCTTYHRDYSRCGNKGTTAVSDDVRSISGGGFRLVPGNIHEYTRCGIDDEDNCPSSDYDLEPEDSGAFGTPLELSMFALFGTLVF